MSRNANAGTTNKFMKCELVGFVKDAKEQCIKNGKCFVKINFNCGSDYVLVPKEFYESVENNSKIKITVETIE